MFSGLVQTQGQVASNNGAQLSVKVAGRIKSRLGDSIAINGVCLTLTRQKGATFYFDVSKETLAKTTLGGLRPSASVNIERALTLQDTLGGHIVQGHVDGTGRVLRIVPQKGGCELYFEGPSEILRYVVPKGSVTVDGVSLTAVKVTKTSFSVALVPYTLAHTNLGNLKKGDPVNLEADIIGKYVAKYLKK